MTSTPSNVPVSARPDALAYGGGAVATLENGKRCFIRGGAPGDSLSVNITSERKKFSIAEIAEILVPSKERTAPECPYYGRCPGCVYQHVSYDCEFLWKAHQMERFIRQSGVAEKELRDALKEPVKAPSRFAWRNKIRLTYEKKDGSVTAGYTGFDNRSIVPVGRCMLAMDGINRLIEETLGDTAFTDSLPEGAKGRLTFRQTVDDGAVCLEKLPVKTFLTEKFGDFGSFSVPAGSFFQVNPAVAVLLTSDVGRIVSETAPETFFELYCGCGLFSAVAAMSGAKKVFGVESDPASVAAARKNLSDRGLAHAKTVAGDAGKMFGKAGNVFSSGSTLLLVDPPRTGLDEKMRINLLDAPAERLIYVSCGPDTLSRDLFALSPRWKLSLVRMFDMFPSTAHFETLVLLERRH